MKIRKSFWRGTGSVMNIAGNYFGSSASKIKTNAEAIYDDWATIGNDINFAMANVVK